VQTTRSLNGKQVPKAIEVITFGGQVDDEVQTWTHLLNLNVGDKGVFFLNPTKKENGFHRSGHNAFDVYASSQGFIHYQTNESKALIAREPFREYLNIETDLLHKIEQKTGFKASQVDSEAESYFRSGIRFHFKNIQFDGLKVRFDLYVNSLIGSKVLNSAGIQLSYNPVFFGNEIVANGGFLLTEFGISLDNGYDFVASDLNLSTTKIALIPNPALGDKVIIGANEQLLGKGYFVIKNPLADPGISYQTQQSKALNTYIEGGQVNQFDTVVVEGSWRPDDCLTIYGISPDTLAGGVGDILTIKGKCFGPFIEGLTNVFFTDASKGPLPLGCEPLTTDHYISCGAPGIICWTDSLIKVKVPSVHQITLTTFSDNIYAGTGQVAVSTATALVYSPDTLTVKYSAFNTYTSASETPSKTALPWTFRDANGNGGYTLTYGSGMLADTAAQGCFQRALDTWRCATKVNFTFDPTNPNLGGLLCKIDLVDTFAGVSSATATTTSSRTRCDASGVFIKAYMTKFDIMFNKKQNFYKRQDLSFFDTTYVDMQSTALHEIGHAHLLNHVNNNDPMFYTRPKGIARRTLSGFDIEGGLKMMQINNAVYLGSNCNTAVMQPHICIVNSSEPFDAVKEISPIPNPANLVISFDQKYTQLGCRLSLYSTTGQLVYSDELKREVDVSQLTQGVYIGHVTLVGKAISHFKFIKL
jgi:hypothetical protein